MRSLINITETEFELIRKYIKKNCGINLGDEKKTLLKGRLGNRILNLGFKSFTEYYEYLLRDNTSKALYDLVDRITTNHTFFMRESGHFEFFQDQVLPWLKSKVRDRELRIWSAGCSSGQEPYTLAMVMDEFFGLEKQSWKTDILATDISSKVLKEAKAGVYTEEQLEILPPKWKQRHFSKLTGDKYEVNEKLKKELVIRQFNLMEEVFPFKKKFQVIFCRNVMIYFDEATKQKLVEKFYRHMEPGGYLFIGHSETLGKEHGQFKYVVPSIYRKE